MLKPTSDQKTSTGAADLESEKRGEAPTSKPNHEQNNQSPSNPQRAPTVPSCLGIATPQVLRYGRRPQQSTCLLKQHPVRRLLRTTSCCGETLQPKYSTAQDDNAIRHNPQRKIAVYEGPQPWARTAKEARRKSEKGTRGANPLTKGRRIYARTGSVKGTKRGH